VIIPRGTFGKPRIVSCAELHPRHLALPRGCHDDVVELLKAHGVKPEIEDLPVIGSPLPPGTRFTG
jgi:hypothetical protein